MGRVYVIIYSCSLLYYQVLSILIKKEITSIKLENYFTFVLKSNRLYTFILFSFKLLNIKHRLFILKMF